MFVCAGESEQFDFATPIGIGPVDAAINLTRLCLMQPPEFLVFVGTAGSYGRKEIFEIVESRTAANIEVGFFDGKCYTPIDNVVSTADDVSRETIVNSSAYITTDSEASARFLEHDIELENMEFYAVLKVAKELNIPAGGVFIVTNYCDPNAHETFVKNHDEAKKRLSDYIRTRHG
jgi:nucleoside phosphorylase